jgi:hypothetical protein
VGAASPNAPCQFAKCSFGLIGIEPTGLFDARFVDR